ncbi:TetR/AcrR family transcriptional regulator [Rhodococcus aetherivorans]|uniref:TetR/AcrR family transcriptional regulator n=1 Tax=Rhodococcus aetherivorans TaxID=191292 RepID=UPI0029499423|nr:TetR/AcrR family transcriptional regulator [Rhodococcus aetherivorans]MDV6291464.1 TetR/AcrR family transcriptional regulator [Rhodococcus aetherivorans]
MSQPDLPEERRLWAKGAGKRRKLSSSELRQRLFDTALDMLSDTGLTVSLAHLNMEELIRLADVPRSSVYREWETKEAFYLDLMERMIEPERSLGVAFDQQTLDIAAAVIQQYQDRLDTPDGRRSVLRETIRQGVERNFYAVSKSLSWRTFIALVATLPALPPDARERLLEALRTAEAHFIDRMVEFYSAMIVTLGLRVKPEFNLHLFATTVSSLVEGMIARQLTNPGIVSNPVMLPGIDDEPVEWHLSAAAFLGVVDLMVEPDPKWQPL